jgi:60 kDa SS-A/Ro ribonucleoprotein
MAVINVKQFSRKSASTPQTQAVPGKNQVQNNAGGFVFQITPWDQMRRYLILGAEGGTYYVSEQDLTKQSYKNVLECIKADGKRAVDMIVEVSDKALAPKNDPAIFALALCAAHGDDDTKAYAFQNLTKVCRIGTHILHFGEYVNALRGWGRGLRNAVGRWYLEKDADALAYQAIKYQSRDGWSHRDLLRLAHPSTKDAKQDAVLRWMIGGLDALAKREFKRRIATTTGKGKAKATTNVEREVAYPARKRYLPEIIEAFEQAKTADEATLVKLITEHDLPREAIPTDKLNSLKVWEALLEKMPMTAMVRNLGKMTSIGLLKPLSAASKKVTSKLKDVEQIQKSRIHPMAILIALKVYESGHGVKGDLSWQPVPAINEALDDAFYLAFGNVRKTGKSLLFALDVSASMSSAIAGSPLSCCEGATALALVHANVEDDYHIMRFNLGIENTPIRKGMRLDAALKYTRSINGGGTDCSLPAQWALKNKVEIGGIVNLTDNETWGGSMHPFQALTKYRQAHVADCRQVVVGMTATGFSIADPSDKLSMDVVGFDASAPNVIADFIRGELT